MFELFFSSDQSAVFSVASSMGLLRSPCPRLCGETEGMRTRRSRPVAPTPSAFAGFRFPPDVIVLAVRWYLRFGLSLKDTQSRTWLVTCGFASSTARYGGTLLPYREGPPACC